jgi:hypothetical protein
MPTIPQMIRTGKGEWSSSALLRDGVLGTGDIMYSEDRLAAADRIDALESELENAVRAAFYCGAVEWTKSNYPEIYRKLIAQEEKPQ